MITITGIGGVGVTVLVLTGGYVGMRALRMWRYRREIKKRLEMWTLDSSFQRLLNNENV
jgi:hypothetical protein